MHIHTSIASKSKSLGLGEAVAKPSKAEIVKIVYIMSYFENLTSNSSERAGESEFNGPGE